MTDRRGFVLVGALVLAVLYFGLMELLMIDASRALGEARRFRARIVAATLAENAAELSAESIATRLTGQADTRNAQGTMSGRMSRTGEAFLITGEGVAEGVTVQKSSVTVQGRVSPSGVISIDYTMHGF